MNIINEKSIPLKNIEIDSKDFEKFRKYLNDFYGKRGVYPNRYGKDLQPRDVLKAIDTVAGKNPKHQWDWDSLDRELVRDELIKMRKFDYPTQESAIKELSEVGKMFEDETQDPQEIKVGEYQTKFFDVCPGASQLYKDIESKGVDLELAERSVKLQDALFAIEKHILQDWDWDKVEKGEEESSKEKYWAITQNIVDQIRKMAEMMDLVDEHSYIQGHLETIEKALYGDEEVEPTKDTLEGLNEVDVVGKTIFSDGKGKLFFGYYYTDDGVQFVDYKTWKKLNFKDVSKGDTNKDRVIKAIVKNQKQFNKKVDFNMWAKKQKRSFEDTMDWFIKNGWISNITKRGIKESVDVLSVTEGKKVFKVNPQIGKSKYSISYHDGKSKHKDGSDFHGIETFKNKKDLEKAIKKYTSQGFKMESVNEDKPPKGVNLSIVDKEIKRRGKKNMLKHFQGIKKDKLYSKVNTPKSIDYLIKYVSNFNESVNEESINEAKIYKVIFAGKQEKNAKDFFTMIDKSPKIKAMTKDSGVFKVGNEVTIRFGVGSKQELELIKKVAKLEGLKIVKIDESVNEGKKRYYQQDRVGSAKYTISYHDGKKKHKDGSDFFDIKTFKNQRDLAKFVNGLHRFGFVYGHNESINERSINSISKAREKNATRIKDTLELYKLAKGGNKYYNEKNIIKVLKKLNDEKKKLEKELDDKISGLYKDAEFKEAKLNHYRITGNSIEFYVKDKGKNLVLRFKDKRDFDKLKLDLNNPKDLQKLLDKRPNKMSISMGESVNEGKFKPSQVRSAISKVKKQLMKKWQQKGGYENFGQKELSQLQNKFDYNAYGDKDEREISHMLDAFDNWAMNYDGSMREDVNEIPGRIPSQIKVKLEKALDVLDDKKLTYPQRLKVLATVMGALGIDRKELSKITTKIKSTLD